MMHVLHDPSSPSEAAEALRAFINRQLQQGGASFTCLVRIEYYVLKSLGCGIPPLLFPKWSGVGCPLAPWHVVLLICLCFDFNHMELSLMKSIERAIHLHQQYTQKQYYQGNRDVLLRALCCANMVKRGRKGGVLLPRYYLGSVQVVSRNSLGTHSYLLDTT